MTRKSKKYLLLLLILIFAFGYRVMLMLWAGFPPGADIGLHESVINSITSIGNVDFLHNNYQMGGGLSLTFPGYHIFVSQLILFTGMPDFWAHTLVVATFSTFIVACAFLLTRRLWAESTAFIVAFLVAVSRFDIEMLLWGGYPNVVTLMLIPLVIYLILESKRFSAPTFLFSVSLLSGALFLTHSLSALVFDGTILVFVVFAAILSRKIELPRKRLLIWLSPIFLGAIVVSPFLVKAIPAYLSGYSGGASDIQDALLSTRILPWELLVPITFCVVFFFLFARVYKGKYVTLGAVLLSLWILVPVAFTQGYFVGFYTDYNRFLYFILLPILILVGIAIEHVALVFSRVTDTYVAATKGTWQKNKIAIRLSRFFGRKTFFAGALLASLLFSFLVFGLFITPWQGTTVQGFYQVMTYPGNEAIQWVRLNTPSNAVFVSDALYGWWLGGFAQRPTLSAVDPQYLTLARELDPANNASYLMDTDYAIDNGLIQVREDGGYTARHNPMFSAKIDWSFFPYSFFNFNNDETTVTLFDGNKYESFDLSQLSVTDMHTENRTGSAAIYVTKANTLFSYTQIVTVYPNLKFANISITLEPGNPEVRMIGTVFTLQSKGLPVDLGSTVGFYDEGGKVLGQLIFTKELPAFPKDGSSLFYTFSNNQSPSVEIWASAFSVSKSLSTLEDPGTEKALSAIMRNNLLTYEQPEENNNAVWPPIFFDYKQAMAEWNVSYIVVRNPEIIQKFAFDPAYSLLFINEDVAIFAVK